MADIGFWPSHLNWDEIMSQYAEELKDSDAKKRFQNTMIGSFPPPSDEEIIKEAKRHGQDPEQFAARCGIVVDGRAIARSHGTSIKRASRLRLL